MKQRIEPEQYESLSTTAKLKWREWCLDKEYGSTFAEDEFIEDIQPTIGILIEYLEPQDINTYQDKGRWYVYLNKGNRKYYARELIDALYFPWKQDLEK